MRHLPEIVRPEVGPNVPQKNPHRFAPVRGLQQEFPLQKQVGSASKNAHERQTVRLQFAGMFQEVLRQTELNLARNDSFGREELYVRSLREKVQNEKATDSASGSSFHGRYF